MTYDRFLTKSFIHTFVVCFITIFGLYIVIDLFENLDEYIFNNKDRGTASLLTMIGTLSVYRAILTFDLAGSALAVITVMTVLIILQRTGELHPLLASGIPMYRILAPVILAGASVNGILILNQELLVPRVSVLYHALRYGDDKSRSMVDPITDLSTKIMINGEHVNSMNRTIEKPVIVLPPQTIVKELTEVEAEIAVFCPARKGKNPAGWLLRNVSRPSVPALAEQLTAEGRKIVTVKNSPDVFVASEITCDQLCNRSSSYTSLSTLDLLDRLRCPAFGAASKRRLELYFHLRFVQPLMNIIGVLITVPLMVRRESTGLVADSSLCGLVLGTLFGITQFFQIWGASGLHFGEMNLTIGPELAAWGPVIISGSISAWLTGIIRT